MEIRYYINKSLKYLRLKNIGFSFILGIISIIGLIKHLKDNADGVLENVGLVIVFIFLISSLYLIYEYIYKSLKIKKIYYCVKENNELIKWIYKEKYSIFDKLNKKLEIVVVYFSKTEYVKIVLSKKNSDELYKIMVKEIPNVSFGWDDRAFVKFKRDDNYLYFHPIQSAVIRQKKGVWDF